jgi:hypothetical protein
LEREREGRDDKWTKKLTQTRKNPCGKATTNKRKEKKKKERRKKETPQEKEPLGSISNNQQPTKGLCRQHTKSLFTTENTI